MKYLILLLISFNAFAIIGTGANQVPANGMLGSMAFERVQNYSDSMVARAENRAGTSVTASDTDIPFATSIISSIGSIASSGTFTASSSGIYLVCSKISFSAQAYTSADVATLNLWLDGGFYSELDRYRATATTTIDPRLGGCDTVTLSSGSVIKIVATNNRTGGAATLSTSTGYNYFTVVKVSR